MNEVRRKGLVHLVERVAVACVLLVVVFYFGLVRMLDHRAQAESQNFSVVSRRFLEAKERVALLERFHANLPVGKQQVGLFESQFVPPRRRGFSRAEGLIRGLTRQSGVELSNLSYRLDSSRDEPLKRLGIEVSVEGPFSSLLNFTHALETAGDFVVLRDFAFEALAGGVVGLRLGADLYLTP
jgi:Tfp pilus assembly protein PilO